MPVLPVKNKGGPCSHRAGMDPRRCSINTRTGMMLETVTLLNAAQTYWRLTLLHNAHERQICRGVFDIGVLSHSLSLSHFLSHSLLHTHTHANRSSLSITRL